MKLKVYNTENSKTLFMGKSIIRVNRRAGLISLSKTAYNFIGFQENDKIEIVQDEDNPSDFYIHKTSSPLGFELRSKNSQCAGASFNCAKVANLILQNPKVKAAGFYIGGKTEIDGIVYYPILTAKPMNEKLVGDLSRK